MMEADLTKMAVATAADMETLVDTDGDLKKLFDELDTDKSGTLEVSELKATRRDCAAALSMRHAARLA